MTSVTQYRIYCTTEADWITAWSETPLTVCPNNNGHTVNANSVQSINTVSAGQLEPSDNAASDSFGRFRVSNPITLFSTKLLRQSKELTYLYDEDLISGSGISSSTPTLNKPYIDITSTASTAGHFIRQTRYSFDYRPGTSFLILMTGVMDLSGGGTGAERYFGYFNDDNGLYFCLKNGVFGVAHRTKDSGSVVSTEITQTNFNIDVMDGNGISGLTLDLTKSQIFVIDFQWLSIGRVRYGVDINGLILYFHSISFANNQNIPYMATSNLPLRHEMVTTASTPATSMRVICSSVIIEGTYNPPVYLLNISTNGSFVNANSTSNIYILKAVRLKTGFEGASVSLRSVSLLAATPDGFEWYILLNPTYSGTLTFSNVSDSACQEATGDTANNPSNTTITTTNFIIASGFGNETTQNIDITSKLRLGTKIDGTQDVFVLAVRPLSANLDIYGSMILNEIFV